MKSTCLVTIAAPAFLSYNGWPPLHFLVSPSTVRQILIPSFLQDFAPNHPSPTCAPQLPLSLRSFPSGYQRAVTSHLKKTNSPLTLFSYCPISFLCTSSPPCPLSPPQLSFCLCHSIESALGQLTSGLLVSTSEDQIILFSPSATSAP